MALIDDLLGLGFDISQYKNLSDELKAFGTTAETGMAGIGQTAATEMALKPFTVTSGTGTATTTAEGGTTLGLSPEQQALATGLETGAAGLLPQATTRTGTYDPFGTSAFNGGNYSFSGGRTTRLTHGSAKSRSMYGI